MWLNKTFVITMLILAVFCALIGMITGPLGFTEISIGTLITACIFAIIVICFGLSQSKNKKR